MSADVSTLLLCEVLGCDQPAAWRVGTFRGEGLRVCSWHLDTVKRDLVGRPVVRKLT